MPYVVKDQSGAIIRVSARPLPLADIVAPDDSALLQFLRNKGQNVDTILEAFQELRKTDADMSRAIEDVIMALMRKNLLKLSDLPQQVQDKMNQRTKLRVQIQDAYDQASGQQSVPYSIPGHY